VRSFIVKCLAEKQEDSNGWDTTADNPAAHKSGVHEMYASSNDKIGWGSKCWV